MIAFGLKFVQDFNLQSKQQIVQVRGTQKQFLNPSYQDPYVIINSDKFPQGTFLNWL